MLFVINGMKYDTEKMEKVAEVKKWYREDNFINQVMFPGQKVGRIYCCRLWRSPKGNWLLTHEKDHIDMGEAIKEKEARTLLMKYATETYENMFGELSEA